MSISIEQKEETLIRKFDELLKATNELNDDCLFLFEDVEKIKEGNIPDPGLEATRRCFIDISSINDSLIDFLAEAHGLEFENNNDNNNEE